MLDGMHGDEAYCGLAMPGQGDLVSNLGASDQVRKLTLASVTAKRMISAWASVEMFSNLDH